MKKSSYEEFAEKIPANVLLLAVSKTKPNEQILNIYNQGQRHFGENKVQELIAKNDELPKDIHWHMIGHLQRNKVKYIAPFISLIHSVDSLRLLKEINKQAIKNDRVINCLLQVHIANEETKFGFSFDELKQLFTDTSFVELNGVQITGLMGMATNTNDKDYLKKEFTSLKKCFVELKETVFKGEEKFSQLSMGMSSDYEIAIENGSTIIRVGSAIFGAR